MGVYTYTCRYNSCNSYSHLCEFFVVSVAGASQFFRRSQSVFYDLSSSLKNPFYTVLNIVRVPHAFMMNLNVYHKIFRFSFCVSNKITVGLGLVKIFIDQDIMKVGITL